MAMADMSKYWGIFILVIVGLSLVAALYPEASDATDSVSDEGMCTAATSCFYNATRGTVFTCTANNLTPQDTTVCADPGYANGGFPLSGLVAGGGVLFIVLAAGLLMLYIKKSK